MTDTLKQPRRQQVLLCPDCVEPLNMIEYKCGEVGVQCPTCLLAWRVTYVLDEHLGEEKE